MSKLNSVLTTDRRNRTMVVLVSACFYVMEAAWDEPWIAILGGLGVFLAIHGAVITAKHFIWHGHAREAATPRVIKFLTLSSLSGGLMLVLAAYVCRWPEGDWRAYVEAVTIGGLSAVSHVVPWETCRHRTNLIKVKEAKRSGP